MRTKASISLDLCKIGSKRSQIALTKPSKSAGVAWEYKLEGFMET
jgi:hypothetical protein